MEAALLFILSFYNGNKFENNYKYNEKKDHNMTINKSKIIETIFFLISMHR